MLEIILDSLVPIFFGMGLGYVAGWTRDIDNKHVGELNALVMDFALPAAIFGAVAQQSRGALLAQIPLAANLSISMLLLYVVTYFMARQVFHASPPEASAQALTTSSPNFGAAGLPLVGALFGAHYLVAVAVALAVTGIVLSPLTLIILERHAGAGHKRGIVRSLLSAYKKPIVLTPLVAVLFVLSGIGMPEPLTKSFSLMGQLAGGTALFLTGLILSAQKIRLGKSVAIQTLLANIIHPLLAAGLAVLFAVSPLTAREAIVLSALPAGFFGILFGLRFGIASEVTGTTLVVSTILSAATLSAAIYLTDGMGP
jgi:malonate transporter